MTGAQYQALLALKLELTVQSAGRSDSVVLICWAPIQYFSNQFLGDSDSVGLGTIFLRTIILADLPLLINLLLSE